MMGDTGKGANLFAAKCAVCHKNGKGGGDIGPDLSSIGNKLDKTAMLKAISEPNAAIVFGYAPIMIKTKSGQVFNGFLLSEGATIVLKDVLGNTIVIAPEDVEVRKKLESGFMPDAADLKLSEQDLADLMAYLLTMTGELL